MEEIVFSRACLKFFTSILESSIRPDSDLFDQIFRALGFISSYNIPQVCLEVLLNSGLIEVVYSFFQSPDKLGGSEKLLQRVIFVLANITHGIDKIKALLIKAGAIGKIMQFLEAFKSDESIDHGIWFLDCITTQLKRDDRLMVDWEQSFYEFLPDLLLLVDHPNDTI